MTEIIKPAVIEGTAIKFNTESVLISERGMQFKEIILPEAITESFLLEQDIVLNIRHDNEKVLARWNKGQGDLKLTVDNVGIHFRAEFQPDEMFDKVKEAQTLIKHGTYPGCSFEFIAFPDNDPVANEFIKGSDGIMRKYIHRIARLEALTIALHPAYKETSVKAREQQKSYGFTEREVKIITGSDNADSLVDLQLRKAKVEAVIKSLEIRDSLGQDVDIDSMLTARSELRLVEAEIEKLTNQ